MWCILTDTYVGDLEKSVKTRPCGMHRESEGLPNPDFDVQIAYNPSTDGDFFDWLERKNRCKNGIQTGDSKFPEPARNQKTGVMNPYLLAHVISMSRRTGAGCFALGRSKKVFHLRSDDLVEAVNAYKKGSITCYQEIFQPDKSPLFRPLEDSPALQVRYGMAAFPHSAMMAGALHATQALPSVTTVHPAVSERPETITRASDTGVRSRHAAKYEGAGVDVGSGVMNLDLQYHVDGQVTKCTSASPGIRFGLDTGGVTVPAACGIITRPTTKTRRDLLNDPMQGICLDCYFMAALFSVAWKYFATFPPALNPDSSTGKYSISFYDTTASLAKRTQAILPTFPQNTSSQMIFAQQTPEFELWTALYEKAYAKFRGLAAYNPANVPGATTDDPNIGLISAGDPVTAMTEICKLLATARSDNNAAKRPSIFNTASRPFVFFANTPDYYVCNRSYDVLNAFDASSYLAVNYITMFPTVAWTSDTVQASSNHAIVPSHAYSILGLLDKTNAAGGTDNYIVLRNPWANKIDPGNDTRFATGNWTPESGLTLTFGLIADGIFAIKADAFDTLFSGFGWVQFSSLTG
jgi:hypothetical protein